MNTNVTKTKMPLQNLEMSSTCYDNFLSDKIAILEYVQLLQISGAKYCACYTISRRY